MILNPFINRLKSLLFGDTKLFGLNCIFINHTQSACTKNTTKAIAAITTIVIGMMTLIIIFSHLFLLNIISSPQNKKYDLHYIIAQILSIYNDASIRCSQSKRYMDEL